MWALMWIQKKNVGKKCTELREQWNLTWLQIHCNTLPKKVDKSAQN